MTTNENSPVTSHDDQDQKHSDSHGKAALLLVESLVHGLCEKTTLSTIEAVNITERAISVQHERATEAKAGEASMWRSHALLTAIASSLRADVGNDPFTPQLVPPSAPGA